MTSTIKCSGCDSTTSRTDVTQDISLHIEEDASSSLVERIYDFFPPATLEGANAYWCDECQKSCLATKTLLYTRTPTILIVHLKRLILGKKTQQHIPFDITLNLEPYVMQGYPPIPEMELIGIIKKGEVNMAFRAAHTQGALFFLALVTVNEGRGDDAILLEQEGAIL